MAHQVNGSLEKVLVLRNEARTDEHGEGVKREPEQLFQFTVSGACWMYNDNSLGWMYANGRGMQRDLCLTAAYSRHGRKEGA